MIRFTNSYAQLPETFYSRVELGSTFAPQAIVINEGLCEELGVSASYLASKSGLDLLVGNAAPNTARPIAMVYGGHQFGHWNPQLGDGRAVLIGELVDKKGQRRDLHLKGAGRTAYSRGGDGKATLGSVLREFIISEAMHALGVPTTRALAVVTTGETVARDRAFPGAVLARVAHSHVRVGTFEYFAHRGETHSLRALADYVLERNFPKARTSETPYLALLREVVERQASLVAKWMQLGFIHGVMNTDNSQIAGETIDFGPCAFIDDFHPKRCFSSIDRQGRYAWENQPVIAQWNMERFAEALLPLLDPDPECALTLATQALSTFSSHFEDCFVRGFMEKFGMKTQESSKEEDRSFIGTTLTLLARQEVDFTRFFRGLSAEIDNKPSEYFLSLFGDHDSARSWLVQWQRQASRDALPTNDRKALMALANPIYIPRNHRVEEAIENANEGNFQPFHSLVDVLSNPYQERPEFADYERAPTPAQKVQETFCGT